MTDYDVLFYEEQERKKEEERKAVEQRKRDDAEISELSMHVVRRDLNHLKDMMCSIDPREISPNQMAKTINDWYTTLRIAVMILNTEMKKR